MSDTVMPLNAPVIFSSKAFRVLAFTFRRKAFIFDHIISMGLRSGLYGGKYRTVAPAAMIDSLKSSPLSEPSNTSGTISPFARMDDYDVGSKIDDIKDGGKYIGDDIHQLLINMNPQFYTSRHGADEYMRYKNKLPLFVINYERTEHTEIGLNRYKLIGLNAIKSIYINENLSVMCKYADIRMSPMDVDDIYSCAVLIETYPEGQIPVDGAKGVRKTWLEGYSAVKEFYSPDYSVLPPEPDYRRTLYWNPSVVSDENGVVKIKFYNNSRCTKFSISAETITSQGMIGIYNKANQKLGFDSHN